MLDLRKFAELNYKPQAIQTIKHTSKTYYRYNEIERDMLFNGFGYDANDKPYICYRLYGVDYFVYISESDWDRISEYL